MRCCETFQNVKKDSWFAEDVEPGRLVVYLEFTQCFLTWQAVAERHAVVIGTQFDLPLKF